MDTIKGNRCLDVSTYETWLNVLVPFTPYSRFNTFTTILAVGNLQSQLAGIYPMAIITFNDAMMVLTTSAVCF